MKTLLGVVCFLSFLAAAFLLLTPMPSTAFSAFGCALFAGTAYAILDRLDKIATELARARGPETPPRAATPPPLAPPHIGQGFDTAKAVAAMKEAQGLGRS